VKVFTAEDAENAENAEMVFENNFLCALCVLRGKTLVLLRWRKT
jgi:hypothetical protein